MSGTTRDQATPRRGPAPRGRGGARRPSSSSSSIPAPRRRGPSSTAGAAAAAAARGRGERARQPQRPAARPVHPALRSRGGGPAAAHPPHAQAAADRRARIEQRTRALEAAKRAPQDGTSQVTPRGGQGAQPAKPGGNDDDNDDIDDIDGADRGQDAEREPRLPALPIDLPTEYYAAIARAPVDKSPTTYLTYPARVHHLKHYAAPITSPLPNWEALHLHQRVSSPHLSARWISPQPATPAQLARAKPHFLQFHDPAYPAPVLGFRPYADILFLDAAYLTAAAAAAADDDLIPFLPNPADRAKIRTLAVSAAFLRTATAAQQEQQEQPKQRQTLPRLVAAFPRLARLLLVSIAPVPRPASAAWDLATEFARWRPLADAAVEAPVVGTAGLFGGDGDGSCAGRHGKRSEWESAVEVELRALVGGERTVRAEAYVMLYFEDAYDRAVRKGWTPGVDLVSVRHLNLTLA